MSFLDDYFESHSRSMREEFQRARRSVEDSDVKGGVNEAIVARFLTHHMHGRRIARNSVLIDSTGGQSDEVDVTIVNGDQPFFSEAAGQMLLCEGVDAIVQVKARLTDGELKRAVKNAASVKALRRTFRFGDMQVGETEDEPHYVERVPYVVLCFESELTLATIRNRLAAYSPEPTSQLDGLFVLDRGTILNLRNNDGTLRATGDCTGFHADPTETDPLVSFMRTLVAITPRIVRLQSPLLNYWPEGSPGPGWLPFR